MCVSAATLNLQEARKLEWATAISDEEDELPSSRTSLGLLLGGLEDDTDNQEPGFTPVPPASVSPHRSHIHHVASEAEYLLGHLHKVQIVQALAIEEACRTETIELAMLCRLRLNAVWADFMLRFIRFRTESSVACIESGRI